jgi:hypothetical protein
MGRQEEREGTSSVAPDDRHASWRSAPGHGFGGGAARKSEPGAPSDLENAIARGRYGVPHWQEEPEVDDDRAVWGSASRQTADDHPGSARAGLGGLLRRLWARLGARSGHTGRWAGSAKRG